MPALAESAPPTPGEPGDPIVVDVASEVASVQLPGVEARLVAVVTPGGGVFTVKGPAYASNAITGVSAGLINDYCAEKRPGSEFGVCLELRRQSGYRDLLDLRAIGRPKQGPQIIRGDRVLIAGDDINSATTCFAMMELSLVAAPASGTFDLATMLVYGPPSDDVMDIEVDAANAPMQFLGMKITATVLRLPDSDPEGNVPASQQPVVALRFDPPKALPGFEVQAVASDGTIVRAHKAANLSQPPRDGKAEWTFGRPQPVSKSSIAKFVFRGYVHQPIVWKNIALPAGVTSGKGSG